MIRFDRIPVIGAALFLSILVACADPPVVMTRSAIDGAPEPPPDSDAWARHSQSRHASPPGSTAVASTTQTAQTQTAAAPAQKSASTATETTPTTIATSEESVVVLTTNLGKIVIGLDEKVAPKTCANFEKLALQGFYNRTTFHRVIPGFMIQGGDPNSKNSDRSLYGTGGPGYTIPAEINLPPVRGAVAMARLPDQVNPMKESSGSQFFICVADAPHLQGGYTVFGHVIQGMDVADKIVAVNRDDRDNPLERVEMQAALMPKSKALKSSN